MANTNIVNFSSKDETYSKWFTKGASKKAVHLTDSKCPPQPIFGSKGHSRRFDSSCAVDGFDNTSNICADNPCTGSSDCFSLSKFEFHCVCRPGYEKNNDDVCVKIPAVNECKMKNDCSIYADCIDTVDSKGSTDHRRPPLS